MCGAQTLVHASSVYSLVHDLNYAEVNKEEFTPCRVVIFEWESKGIELLAEPHCKCSFEEEQFLVFLCWLHFSASKAAACLGAVHGMWTISDQ